MIDKKFMENAKNALSDKWQQSHQKWLDEQKQQQQYLQQYNKYQNSLRLQKELWKIFSAMSAPSGLKQIRFPSDLQIEDSTNDKIYKFRWTKEKEDQIPVVILNEIKNRLNATICAQQARLMNTLLTLPYPDNEYFSSDYLFTLCGFRVVNCNDDILDIILTIRT